MIRVYLEKKLKTTGSSYIARCDVGKVNLVDNLMAGIGVTPTFIHDRIGRPDQLYLHAPTDGTMEERADALSSMAQQILPQYDSHHDTLGQRDL